ncbi:uncharacterized protein (TIGR02646 family) [Paraburkholderia sp. GAS333]|uniref:hypothetical protein n=1 Tax=Paraburkholderia sp. GAS333 TaxID=3156279 RepID=UPI003D253F32
MQAETRNRATPLIALESVSPEQHATLREGGAADVHYWESHPEEVKPFFKRFKAEIKEYYRAEQGRRCCYCSFELASDHSTFDAEHVLDKNTYPQFMFDPNNLAASCRPCNRAKNKKSVLEEGTKTDRVPIQSVSYKIVHPHLDDWAHHLKFDEISRIVPVSGSAKGKITIDVCKISILNSARLSDSFASGRRVAEKYLRQFYEIRTLKKKREHLELLRALAAQRNLAPALAIVDRLAQEIAEEEAASANR